MRLITLTTSDASGGAKNSSTGLLDYKFGWPWISLQAVVTGTVTFTVQQTVSDPAGTLTWFDHPDTNLVAATGNVQGNYAYCPIAVRLHQTAGTGSIVLTILQAGTGR